MTEWYLVKTNWSATEQRCPGYVGLGGDVWPLDGVREASDVHLEVMSTRAYVDMGSYEELVCTDLRLAQRYAAVARSTLKTEVILVRVSLATSADDPWDGIDLGSPSGGFSLVETNVIHEGRGGCLNDAGLFLTVEELHEFFERYDGEVEDGEFATVRVMVVKFDIP